VLADLVADVPLNRYKFFNCIQFNSDQQLDERRWRVVLAIQDARRALGEKWVLAEKTLPGTPAILAVDSVRKEIIQTGKILYAPLSTSPVSLDDKPADRCWATNQNSTGNLWWTWNTESLMRALAGSLEQFKNNPPPSSAQAQIAYDEKGIYLLAQCNHINEKTARSAHGDDDADLWEDDCMEYFFQPGKTGDPAYHLIVNVKGKRVWMKDVQVVPDSGIQTATVSPINPSGGYSQEVFIPYKAFGLKSSPETGTAWRMQVGREFHSYNQITCWAQVLERFDEANRWGTLIFGGAIGSVSIQDVDLGSRYPGQNRMTGTLSFDDSLKVDTVTLIIFDQADRKIAAEKINRKADLRLVPFSLDYVVQNWRNQPNGALS